MIDYTIEMLKARLDAHTLGISNKGYQVYRAQANSCRRRGIPMCFSLPDWWEWWQVDNRWAYGGNRKGCVLMARFDDTGPYSADNIYCATIKQNARDNTAERRSAAISKSYDRRKAKPGCRHHLSARGDGQPRSIAVITPTGRFGSAALAADAYGIS